MSKGPKVGEKKKFNLPHVFIILFCIMIICAIATYIIPAGTFDYMENDSGRQVAIAGSWHPVDDATPVGPFRLFELVYEGMVNAADISFLVFITYCSVTFIIKSGAFEGAVGALLKIFKGNSSLITIPIFLIAIGMGSSTVGMFEEWLPFIPVFAAIYTGMGYDALTGLMVIAFGAGMGYSGAIMNPFTVGVAQGIAEVPYMSGMGYRLICHAVMVIIASIFIIMYASKVKADPENSYVYGIEGLVRKEGEEIDHHVEFKLSHKLILLDLLAAIVIVVIGVMKWGWYFSQICAVFLIMAIIAAIIMFVFMSLSLPFLLVIVIECAIFINMGLAFYTGTSLPFIASIVIGTIQLGSTVDYAILMTSRYQVERRSGKDKKEAVLIAHKTSIQSIFVSAMSFFAATFGVGMYSGISVISSLCMLMARGAIISMVTVVFALPAILLLFDPVIIKTSKGFVKTEKIPE